MESVVPIWSLIGISEQEYNYRFNMPIKIEQEIKEEIKEETKEEIKEEINEEKDDIKDDYKNMTFEPKPSLVRKSKSLRFKTNAPEWI
jgi:AAA15 family ATPase/GTPase